MDAVEYLTELNRMCAKSNICDDCPIYKATGGNCGLAYNNAEMLAGHVGIVEQWAKEHPFRTRQSVFLERYPNARLDYDNVLVICPRSIEQNGCDKFDDHILMCSDCRRKYWSEEVQDEDEG